MLDIKLLRESPEKVKKGVVTKNVDAGVVDEFLRLDEEWRQLQNLIDNLRAEHNKLSKARNLEEAKKKKEEIKLKESEFKEVEEKRNAALLRIPNLPFDEVPVGGSEKDNVVMREVGEKPKLDFKPKSYLELAEKLNLVDTERAAKTSGSRFGFLLGAAARLEFALVQLAIKVVTDRSLLAKLAKKNHLNIKDLPFVPVVPPVLINKKSMGGMGYLERGAEEVYYLPADDLYLVGTAEQSIGPMHQDEVFEEKDLPRRYIGFSTCFRREAGSYGKDTKGILRVHQFDKLEMFVFATPETSRAEHRLMLAIEEYLMQLLCLPYRVLNICSADLGDPAAAKFDIEVWLPGQNGGIGEYRETHSTSNTTDFQARRLNVKYRPARDRKQDTNDKKSEYVHMLNGTAFAIGRTLIAIMENYQTKEGKIKIPKVLQKYIGEKIIG
jgi:seryl-tRNA synthetase